MRVNTNTDNIIAGNMTGEKITMELDATATAHLVGVLTRLYERPEEAAIREYATNARDSHIEAGVTRPIEVTLPGPLSMFLTVRDFGVGLSVSELHEIYSKYGRSTKRDSDDVQGCLGLGCKSALAYTNQFTLVSVKDGVKATVAISKNAQGVGEMTVVDTSSTMDHNGVEVRIPAKQYNTMANTAKEFFSYWEKGTVLVDGQEPASVRDDPDVLWVSDSIGVRRNQGYRAESTIVMGNVAYPAPTLEHGMSYGNSLIAYVEMGGVAFTPSREGLEDIQHTRDRLAKVLVDFEASCAGAIQREVDKAETPQQALKIIARFSEILPKSATSSRYRFRGRDVPMTFDAQKAGGKIVMIDAHPHKLSAHSDFKTVAMNVWCDSAIWVTGYDAQTFTAGQRKKIDHFFEEKQVSWSRMLLTNAKPPKSWIDPDSIYLWEDIKAVKLPRTVRGAYGRITGSYDCYTYDGTNDSDGTPEIKWVSEKVADEIDDSEAVYYFNKTATYASILDVAKILASKGDPFTLVEMIETRVNKFCRFFPEAENGYLAAKKVFTAWEKKISKNDRIAMTIQKSGYGYYHRTVQHVPDYCKLDPAKCDDPEIAKWIKLAKRDVKALREQALAFEDALGLHVEKATDVENPMSKYPLWDDGHLATDAEHLYAYLNWVYSTLNQTVTV